MALTGWERLDLDGKGLSKMYNTVSLLYFRCTSCTGKQVDFIARLGFHSTVLLLSVLAIVCWSHCLALLIELIDSLTNSSGYFSLVYLVECTLRYDLPMINAPYVALLSLIAHIRIRCRAESSRSPRHMSRREDFHHSLTRDIP
jgi:hypothetical protein